MTLPDISRTPHVWRGDDCDDVVLVTGARSVQSGWWNGGGSRGLSRRPSLLIPEREKVPLRSEYTGQSGPE